MSVYKRGGVYWYEFWFRGQRFRQSTGLNNKTVALRAEAIRKAELAEGRAGIAQRKICPAFEIFVKDEFLPWSEKQHEAHPKTHKRYKVSAKPLIAFFGKLPLDVISTAHVEKFKLERAGDISSAGTNRDLAALRFMLNFAMRQDYIAKNPVARVKFLPEGPGCMRVVTHEEQKRYLAKADALLRDIALLILETGMRPEEVFSIRRENAHLAARYLFVPKDCVCTAKRPVDSIGGGGVEATDNRSKGRVSFSRRTQSAHRFSAETARRGIVGGRDYATFSPLRSAPHVRHSAGNGGS